MKKLFVLLMLFCLSGCAIFKGGMPTPPFNITKDMEELKKGLEKDFSVSTYYAAPSERARNRFVSSRLIIINIDYINYIKKLSADEAQLHAAADILTLSLDIAATAFTPTNTKTILSAISSGIGGARLSIDENFFHKKTVPVLISAMNSERKVVLERIISGIGRDLNGYPFEQALSDVNDYYLAGTIQGALATIQRDSGAKENKADSEIKEIMINRSSTFVDATLQARVDKLLDQVGDLNQQKISDLCNNPPVSDSTIQQIVQKRDPGNKRQKDPDVALKLLKMQIVLSGRDEKSLAAWEAAIRAEAKPK